MVLGYYVFESFLYGFVPSAANIPSNGVQNIADLILGVMLIKVFKEQNRAVKLRKQRIQLYHEYYM